MTNIVTNLHQFIAQWASPSSAENLFTADDIAEYLSQTTFYTQSVLDNLRTYPERPGAFESLLAALDEAQESVAIGVLGDSTGNDTDEWVYVVSQYLAAKYPAYTVNYLLFNDSTGAFNAPVVLQSGPNGTRYLTVGSATNLVPNAEITQPTGNWDLRIFVAPTSWTPASQQTFAAKFGASGQRTFRFQLNPGGTLVWNYSTDGSTLVTATSTAVVPNTVAGVGQWLRVTHTMNNGASGTDVKFYVSGDGTNGTSWTQIGSTVTAAGALTSLFSSTADWEIGGRQGTVEIVTGKIYGIDILDSSGVSQAPLAIDQWRPFSSTSGTFGGSPVLTIVNSSVPGKDVTYLSGNGTRSLALLTPKWGQAVILLSCSHNDTYLYGPTYLGQWDSWLTALKSRFAAAQFVVVSQNPRTSPAANIREHAIRRRQLIAWAARNGLAHIDTYRAFRDACVGTVTIDQLVNPADGIHPINNGKTVWATAVETAITRRM